jgi:hypothetical protein
MQALRFKGRVKQLLSLTVKRPFQLNGFLAIRLSFNGLGVFLAFVQHSLPAG